MDLADVFNKVSHKILVSKLKCYNIKDSMLNLLKINLKYRSQSTVINNVLSEREFVNVGILEGSCLGPILLLVYIYDIYSSTEINMKLFADDAYLKYQHRDPFT